jgi:hypothetical protein
MVVGLQMPCQDCRCSASAAAPDFWRHPSCIEQFSCLIMEVDQVLHEGGRYAMEQTEGIDSATGCRALRKI